MSAKKDKKDLLHKLSDEMQTLTGTSSEHHKAMVDFDRADRDFLKRKRTIVGSLLEGLPITALQTYILIEGESMEMVAVLALLLGPSMQGVGDDGNAKQRREDALLEFESLFETSFEQTTAGKKHTSWEQARGSEAAPNTLAPPPQAEVAVVVVAAEQFGVRGEESEREEGAAAAAPAALDRGWPVSFKFKLEVAETLRRGSIAKVAPLWPLHSPSPRSTPACTYHLMSCLIK